MTISINSAFILVMVSARMSSSSMWRIHTSEASRNSNTGNAYGGLEEILSPPKMTRWYDQPLQDHEEAPEDWWTPHDGEYGDLDASTSSGYTTNAEYWYNQQVDAEHSGIDLQSEAFHNAWSLQDLPSAHDVTDHYRNNESESDAPPSGQETESSTHVKPPEYNEEDRLRLSQIPFDGWYQREEDGDKKRRVVEMIDKAFGNRSTSNNEYENTRKILRRQMRSTWARILLGPPAPNQKTIDMIASFMRPKKYKMNSSAVRRLIKTLVEERRLDPSWVHSTVHYALHDLGFCNKEPSELGYYVMSQVQYL